MIGSVRISGILDELEGADAILLIVHGYGGSANSRVCSKMAWAAHAAGMASLRLSMRGADLSGDDFYHGGLTADARAALASPESRHYRKIFLVGYSFGGQIAMRCALDHIDVRIRSVAAICAPLNAAAAVHEFDRPSRSLYRRYVFAGLNRVYSATAARLPTPVKIVRRARCVRERDELTVVPRFGFRSADDYYRRIQASDRLHRLDIPSLLVISENDPIVPPHTLRAAIGQASPALSVVSLKSGGHMFFPSDLDLGQGVPLGLENQVTRWLLANQ